VAEEIFVSRDQGKVEIICSISGSLAGDFQDNQSVYGSFDEIEEFIPQGLDIPDDEKFKYDLSKVKAICSHIKTTRDALLNP
jgi:hypothetical protein